MKTKVFILAMLLSTGAGLAFAADPATAKPESQVAVVYVDPEKFTDVKQENWTENSTNLLDQLKEFMTETGARYVPAGMHLEIKVTDVDLAGDFEPWRGPDFDHVRVIKDIYPPRIKLEFSLTDEKGKVVSSGKRALTDLAYQMRSTTILPRDDYLRHEKELLRDWFYDEFNSLRKG
ncbi:MAG: DUF3016 domain-containing protein [Opitutaceae bacterium]|nr:DUF3016 domain-containing protein [Opitutaceae bacterium]